MGFYFIRFFFFRVLKVIQAVDSLESGFSCLKDPYSRGDMRHVRGVSFEVDTLTDIVLFIMATRWWTSFAADRLDETVIILYQRTSGTPQNAG